MRVLKINGQTATIDEKTAIGVDYQGYDITDPSRRTIKISNNFSIPRTDINMSLIGNFGDPQRLANTAFDAMTIDYWSNNERLINNAKLRIESVGERINLFAYEKPDIWDTFKQVTFKDFATDYLTWIDEPEHGNYSDFMNNYVSNTSGIAFRLAYGNLYNFTPPAESDNMEHEDVSGFVHVANRYKNELKGQDYNGGHFVVYMKSIFQYIEQTYGVDFLTSTGGIVGNVWDDAVANSMYIPIRQYTVFGNIDFDVFRIEDKPTADYKPLDGVEHCPDKTLFDIVNGFFQIFGIVIDETSPNVFRLARFDDLKLADVDVWDERFTGTPKYYPYVKGYAQSNMIIWKEIFKGGSKDLNSKTITCGNKNIDIKKDLFSIDAFQHQLFVTESNIIPNLTEEESFKTIQYLVDGAVNNNTRVRLYINYISSTDIDQTVTMNIPVVSLYSLASEYNLLDEMLDYPEFVEVERWLTINDIHNLEYFKMYYFKHLNGFFFLNKISGFNPDKSNAPTKLELIRIPNVTASIPTL